MNRLSKKDMDAYTHVTVTQIQYLLHYKEKKAFILSLSQLDYKKTKLTNLKHLVDMYIIFVSHFAHGNLVQNRSFEY